MFKGWTIEIALYRLLNPVLELTSNQRTIGPENAHLKPDLGVLSHHEMTLTLNTHKPLLTYKLSASAKFQVSGCNSFQTQ